MFFIKLLFKNSSFFLLIILISNLNTVGAIDEQQYSFKPVVNTLPLPSGIVQSEIHQLGFDTNGFLYVSTGNHLWLNDGIKWHNVFTGEACRIATGSEGEVIIASGSRLSRLLYTGDGSFEIKLQEFDNLPDKNIRNLIHYGEYFFLIYDDRISCINNQRAETLLEIEPGSKVFQTRNNLFIQSANEIFRIPSCPDILRVPELNFDIQDIKDHPNGYLIFPENGKFPLLYSSDFQLIEEFEIPVESICDLELSPDNEMIILGRANGVEIWDSEGNTLTTLNIPGPRDDRNFEIVFSPDGKAFLHNENSVFILNLQGRVKEFDQTLDALIYDLNLLDETLLFATSRGIISYPRLNINFPCEKTYKLVSHNNVLFCRSRRGISVIQKEDGERKELFPAGEFTNKGLNKGFLYSIHDSIYLFEDYDPENNSFKRSFHKKLNPYNFLDYPGLYHLSEGKLELMDVRTFHSRFLSLPKDFDSHSPGGIFRTSSKTWIYDSRRIFFMDDNDSSFLLLDINLPSFIEIEKLQAIDDVHLLGKIRSFDIPGGFFIIDLLDLNTELFTIPGFPAYFSDFHIAGYGTDKFVIATSNQIFQVYKKNKESSSYFYPVIHTLIAGEDTLLQGIPFTLASEELKTSLHNISFRNSGLKLAIGITDFQKEKTIFQYKTGDAGKWSEWKMGEELFIDNVPGKHSLHLRVMDLDGRISRVRSLDFEIKKPFILNWLFLLIVFSVLIFLIFILYKRISLSRYRRNKLPKEKVKVEAFHRQEPEIPDSVNNGDSRSAVSRRKTKWDKYNMVTVLFSDIQGFTKIAEQMNPESLIDELDKFFFHFDSVVEKYEIEKIKTIGDAYMAAGGIPRKNRSNPIEVVLAALEMQTYMRHLQETKVDFWDLRIGIHTGPVIAGVIGHKKRSYDIWGDTVNTASRMESSGEGGKVNISGETYQLVKEYFICEYRGRLPVKYKGNLDMYFVTGLRPELSVNLAGIPNRKFFLELQLLRLNDLEDHIFEKLDEETPEILRFHSPTYARQIYSYAELLAKAENLDVEETLLVRTAILMIPLGYLANYKKPEHEASLLSQQILAEFHYSSEQIRLISNLILSSKYPPHPETLLEKLMVDIRFEYLGRVDYIKMYKLLYLERNEYYDRIEVGEWKESQKQFLQEFEYFTAGARRLRETPFEKQLERIESDSWS